MIFAARCCWRSVRRRRRRIQKSSGGESASSRLRKLGKPPYLAHTTAPAVGVGESSPFFSFNSVTITSVVSAKPLTLARIEQRRARDLRGVDDAHLVHVAVLTGRGVVAEAGALVLEDLATTTSPSSPALSAICRAGERSASAMMSKPIFSSPLACVFADSTASIARRNATPPPGTMPSSAAALVACSASSIRSFALLHLGSVCAPAFTTATPPVSFARRSWSFSDRSRWWSCRSAANLIGAGVISFS
jgi:hypothetical protein